MPSFTLLEPMSTGDLIDRAVRLYRRNFTPLVGITAVPTLIGYVVSLLFWNGYASLLAGVANSRGTPVSAIWMLGVGALGYPVWLYSLLLTISGLSRVVGDYLMLGEPITFRRCAAAVKRRLGAITLMGLLAIAMFIAVYIIVSIVLFVFILAVGLVVGVIAAARLPQWIATVVLVLIVVVAVALILLSICVIVARIVFLPQVVMIEGQSAGNALGRAITLGKGNWYRVGAIALFTYFVSTSLLAAFALPVLVGLYLSGVLTPEFFTSPTWSILYTSFGQVSNLLSLPIWIVSFTLLYFDSRVRKEAYDLDLIAREINPGFYWQPPVQAGAFGYQMPTPSASFRQPVQTSPLGLAGYRPRQQTDSASTARPTSTDDEELRHKFQHAAETLIEREPVQSANASEPAAGPVCAACGADLLPGASFCMNCGSLTS